MHDQIITKAMNKPCTDDEKVMGSGRVNAVGFCNFVAVSRYDAAPVDYIATL